MKKLWLGLLSTFILAGCGDLFMKDKSENGVEFSEAATCELDIDAFSKILEKNIKGDILCLREQLDFFMEIIRTDRPGYISKKVLKEFLLEGPIDVEPDVVDMVDNIFELSFLIMGTERDFIKREEVHKLIDFLAFFNEHIWRSYRFFSSDDSINYTRQLRERQIIFDEFALIAGKLKEIYKPNRAGIDAIDSEKFIFNFFKADVENLERIKSLMFLKRAFLGGEIWELNHIELKRGFEILPYLAQVAFDVIKIENYEFEQQQETLIRVFMKDIEIVKDTMFYDPESFESVFTVYDLIGAIKTMMPDLTETLDAAKYPREIMQIKEIFLGGGGEFFTARELNEFFTLTTSILDEAVTFYRIYDYYEDELNDTAPISHDFSDFPVNNSRQFSYRSNFARIVSNYKFVKGSNTSAFFTHDWNRNPNAFFEIGAMERLVSMIFAFYGSNNQAARGGYAMTLDQTTELIRDFKWILRDFGIIVIGKKFGGEIKSTAENFILMSTLFQYQSDGCGDEVCLEVPEAMEFLLGLLTALSIQDFFTEEMMAQCSDSLDEFDRISPTCFRNNFVKVLEAPIQSDSEGRSIADFMPLLYQSIQDLIAELPAGEPLVNSPGYYEFITATEAFTRSCSYYDDAQTEEVYLRDNDAFAVFAGLLNVESTLLRFDVNRNNQIDSPREGFDELMAAYNSVYQGAVTGLVNPDGSLPEFLARKLAKPVFKYLISRGEVPDISGFRGILDFIGFIAPWNNQHADADRTTVATILRVIGDESGDKSNFFKCDECLRDPTTDCEPADDQWEPRVETMSY